MRPQRLLCPGSELLRPDLRRADLCRAGWLLQLI
jgi:hypothetical protein